MTEPDITNFSSSSPRTVFFRDRACFTDGQDRLPTHSASQALQNLKSTPYKPVSTSLRGLDAFLQVQGLSSGSTHYSGTGGIPRGHVTEIYGPPGVGKTTMG